MRGGEASSVFWSTILMPLVRKSSRLECEDKIRLPAVQISEDTEWLVRKMTRKPVRDLPTEAEAAPVGSSVSEEACGHSARIGRETHICAFALDVGGADMWAAQIFKMSKPPSNYGVKTRRRANDRRPTRIEVIDNAIGDYPYLIRKVEGQKRAGNPTWKYRLRQIGLAGYEDCIREIALTAGLDTADVFGSWADWPGDWASNRVARNDDFPEVSSREPWADEPLVVKETVNIAALKRYASKGGDRREE